MEGNSLFVIHGYRRQNYTFELYMLSTSLIKDRLPIEIVIGRNRREKSVSTRSGKIT